MVKNFGVDYLKFIKRYNDLKREFQNNNDGISPTIAILIILSISAIAGVGVYQLTQKPDVTYNISEPLFSMAGVDMSGLTIIAVAIVVFIVVLLMFRKK